MNKFRRNFDLLALISRARALNARVLLLGLAGAIVSSPAMASAEIYEYMDANGVVTITNVSKQRPDFTDAQRPATDRTVRVTPHPGLRADSYRQHIEHAARIHAIDPALLHAIIAVESDHSRTAVSPKGAIGLMQVLPATGRRFGATDLFNPEQNIEAGARYLRNLAAMFNNDLTLVLAAYNAGENAVARFGNRVPPYPETKNYVVRVIERYRQFKLAPKAAENKTPSNPRVESFSLSLAPGIQG